MEKNRVLIVIEHYLDMGGVGEISFRWMETYAKQGVRVIWLSGDPEKCFQPWKKALKDCGVEIRTPDHYQDLNLEHSLVTAVASYIKDYITLCSVLAPYDPKDIHIFYFLPNLKDQQWNFLEVRYQSPEKEKVVEKLAPIHDRMDAQGRMLFAHPEHITTLEEAYGVKVRHPDQQLMVRLSDKVTYEEGVAERRCASRKEGFRLITCGRFVFPYKGYIIGLVGEYALLKPRYPQLKLEIIGGGEDEQVLLDVIASLPSEIAQDITLHGVVDYKELKGYFDLCHLNIGTGGAVRDGAITGIPSIPITDISAYTCEVSGFFLGDKSIWSITTNPMDVKPLIEQAIAASKEEYLHLCRKAYDTFAEEYQGTNQNWILDRRNRKDVMFEEDDVAELRTCFCGLREEGVAFVDGKTCKTNSQFQAVVEKLSKGEPCYLWGAGVASERIFKYFQDKMNIVGFIDGNEEKQSRPYFNLPVRSPSFLEKEHPFVIPATDTADISRSIFQTLQERGYVLYEDCMDLNSLYLAPFVGLGESP